jgi:hypothetical protein
MKAIDWMWIGKAVQFFIDNEYDYKEVPWVVGNQAISSTIPFGKSAFSLTHPILAPGFLVGSAEQSFVQLMLEGGLPKGKYCAASPCFRDDVIDQWHQLYFFKVELIEMSPNSQNVFEIMDCARAFMENLGNCHIDVHKTYEGYDLILNGKEIGSYGNRQINEFNWTYGTGLALPRFGQALEHVPLVNPVPIQDAVLPQVEPRGAIFGENLWWRGGNI